MRKVLVLMILLTVIPATLFAGIIFDFSVGADAKYKPMGQELIHDVVSGNEYKFKPTDIIPGLALDAKFFIFDVNATVDITEFKSDAYEGSLCSSGFVGGGLSFDIFFVRLSLGAGYSYTFDLNYLADGTANPVFALRSYNTNNYSCTPVALKDFKNATMDIRSSVDCVLGKISAGAYVLLPTDLSISDMSFAKISSSMLGCLKGINGGVRVMFHI